VRSPNLLAGFQGVLLLREGRGREEGRTGEGRGGIIEGGAGMAGTRRRGPQLKFLATPLDLLGGSKKPWHFSFVHIFAN